MFIRNCVCRWRSKLSHCASRIQSLCWWGYHGNWFDYFFPCGYRVHSLESPNGKSSAPSRENLYRLRQGQFWSAYDALAPLSAPGQRRETDHGAFQEENLTSEQLFQKGIQQAIERQRAVVRQALSIIHKKVLLFISYWFLMFRKSFRPVRFATLFSTILLTCDISSTLCHWASWHISSLIR